MPGFSPRAPQNIPVLSRQSIGGVFLDAEVGAADTACKWSLN